MSKTLAVAKKVISVCMGAKQTENLLILTDNGKFELAHVFADAGRELGIPTVLVEGTVQAGGEPSPMAAAALEKADICLMITSGSFTHTHARAAANKRGCRIASMPALTREIVDAALDADYAEIKLMSEKIADLFTRANTLRLTTPLGSDITLDISGRTGLPDTGILDWPGAFGNLPAGESMIAPVEGKGDGVVFVDGVIGGLGICEKPVCLHIKNGRIISFEGDDGKLKGFLTRFQNTIYSIAEFGVGTNRLISIMNNALCDEKVFSTVHLGFGNNLFMGGQQDCNMHFDMVIRKPTVYLDDTCIIRDGEHIY